MGEPNQQSRYYVVFVELTFQSLQEAKIQASEFLAAHLAHSKELHEQGTLVMSGAFLDKPDEPLSTMGILITREAAEAYIKSDPFYLNGKMKKWEIREWSNMFV